MSLEGRIVELEALVAAQAAQIEVLLARIAGLEAGLAPKDSQNSSVPPSRDGGDRRQRRAAEREARKRGRGEGAKTRPPGKQPGAPGSTLQRRVTDVSRRYRPVCCGKCEADLTNAAVTGSVTRQVLDIPEPRLVATDHVAEKRRCGLVTTAVFPAEATAPVCWGAKGQSGRGVSDDPPTHPPGTS